MAFGYQAFILRTLSVFTSIPFNAYLYFKSFVKALYRMFISKKHLLQWMTAEDAAKQVSATLSNHLKQFWINYLVALALIIFSKILSNYPIENTIIAIFFIIGPFLAHAISKNIKTPEQKLNVSKQNYLKDKAFLTWKFFEDNLISKNNYLIPDNYQLNREQKLDYKTSPTNIGLSLTSIISA